MIPLLFFRNIANQSVYDTEIKIASQYFEVTESRINIPEDSLVIGRYSMLPFYQEQERDIKLKIRAG